MQQTMKYVQIKRKIISLHKFGGINVVKITVEMVMGVFFVG